MEFSPRGFQRATPSTTSHASTGAPHDGGNGPVHKKAMQKLKGSKHVAVLPFILLVCCVILGLLVILGISTKSSDADLVKSDDYQAVFLNNGQAYFGKAKINSKYIDLKDVYYLYNNTSGQSDQSSAANLSLVKLGTELHCPKDEMVIYRDQVSFWENLDGSGKVASAIKQWKDANPKGVTCSSSTTQQTTQQSTSPQQTNNTGTNGTNSNSSGTNNNSSTNSNSTPTGSGNGNL